MASSGAANLTEDIIASIAWSTVYWKTLGGMQIFWATIGVLGNCLVGTTLFANKQLRADPNNILLANLAIADGLFAFVLIFTGYWNTTAGTYPFSKLACRFHMLFTASTAQISNNILAAMAIVKFIHVGYPFTSHTILQPVVIAGLCFLCWIPPLVYNSTIFLFSIGTKHFLSELCFPVFTTFATFTNVICFFFFQFATVVVTTGLILRIVHRHHKSIAVMAVCVAGVSNNADIPTDNTIQQSWKAVRMFVVIVLAFFLLQAPLYLCTTLQTICNCLPYELIFEIVMYPFDMNCVVNVFIYFYMEPRFRKAAIQLLNGGR